MHERERHGAERWYVPLLIVALLTGCAGPGGGAVATAVALATTQASTRPPPLAPVPATNASMTAVPRTTRTTVASAVSVSPTARASAVVPDDAATMVAVQIPAPPGSAPYVWGQNVALDALMGTIDDATRQSTAGITVAERRTYTLMRPVTEVVAFYRSEMARRGWTEEPAATGRQGVVTLVFSRNGRTVGGLIVAIDGERVGGRGTLLATLLAKPA